MSDWRESSVAIDQPTGVIFVDGQRCEVLVRSEVQEDGTWHNALVFRRDGRIAGKEVYIVGMDWHVEPEEALERALRLEERDRMALFRSASRPRSPLI
jgi:hypothetical protein